MTNEDKVLIPIARNIAQNSAELLEKNRFYFSEWNFKCSKQIASQRTATIRLMRIELL